MGTTDPLSRGSGAAAVVVRSHPDCRLHLPPPGHPEAPARLQAVLEALRDPPDSGWTVDAAAELPERDQILGALRWIHDPAYIERVAAASRRGSGTLDCDDCAVSPGTFDAAVAAAGLALGAGLDMANSRLWRAFLALRPPGQHAERDRARGYCVFNNVALAAEALVRSWGVPVLIVDLGPHHANGTQSLFYDRAEVGVVSVHAHPAFPGTGAADEVGEGAGAGSTRNIPLTVDADDRMVVDALEAALEEVGTRLRPAVILVSAGFDGHRDDPVGGWRLTGKGVERMTRAVVQAAEVWAEGRILSVLEGGFQIQALAESVRIHVSEMARIGALH